MLEMSVVRRRIELSVSGQFDSRLVRLGYLQEEDTHDAAKMFTLACRFLLMYTLYT